MLKQMIESLHVPRIEGLSRAFHRLGWIGFWMQIVLGSFPVLLMLYVFTFSGHLITGNRAGLQIVEYLTAANLLVLLFLTFWFYRYTRLAVRIADPKTRPTENSVLATVWAGLVASTLGIFFSMVVLLVEVGQLLFFFLSAPQGGIPTLQTTPAGAVASWVSTVDIASLMALLLTLSAEVVTLVLGLWLMFRTTQNAEHFPQTA